MTSLPPIPAHLPAWQARHLAWLASRGEPTRYAVPDGTVAERADLTGAVLNRADLRWANLTGADLTGARLYRADLTGAVLTGARLTDAVLRGANLSGADLTRADLYCADLTEANLTKANLTEADLYRADLDFATGIASIGPVGRDCRTIHAVAHDDGPRIQAGLWWGTVDDTIEHIKDSYDDDHAERDRYVAAVRAVAALVSP